ncbi:MAG: hypothetical protein D3906_07895, partial [Candidatus Electrothrix sp. AUS1_2]|nr:hypothetical protein [Candidatus Electrothrix sp. AUS1_2]
MSEQLARKARLSVYWNTGFNLFRDTLQFAVMLVLVRLVAPEAYGQFGMVNSIVGFVSVFSFHNFIAHTLQIRGDEPILYQEHFTAGAILQIGLFLLINVVAVLLRYVHEYAPLSPLLHVLSLTFLLEWPCELRRKMLERQLDWKHLRLLHAAGLFVSSVLAVCIGLAGEGVYALLIPGLFVTLPFIFDLFIIQQWRPTWQWNTKDFMPALEFGLNRMGSELITKLRPLLENGFIVHIFGYTAGGLIEYRFVTAYLQCMSNKIMKRENT